MQRVADLVRQQSRIKSGLNVERTFRLRRKAAVSDTLRIGPTESLVGARESPWPTKHCDADKDP